MCARQHNAVACYRTKDTGAMRRPPLDDPNKGVGWCTPSVLEFTKNEVDERVFSVCRRTRKAVLASCNPRVANCYRPGKSNGRSIQGIARCLPVDR